MGDIVYCVCLSVYVYVWCVRACACFRTEESVLCTHVCMNECLCTCVSTVCSMWVCVGVSVGA